jgi:hypothetical protein
MNFESLFSEWEKDADIDKTDLANEALKIPKLHHKYYRLLVTEKSRLKKLESEYKKLRLEKTEFFTQGHDDETRAKGWKLPAKGIIIKSDIPMYLDADQDLIDISLQIGIQQEKVEFLDSIIKTLNNRGYIIKTAVEFIRFTMGG